MSNSNIDIKALYNKIDFVKRYESICKRHNDFETSLNGNQSAMYSRLIASYGYEAKFYKSESFYKIEDSLENFNIILQLTLKNGLVEAMLFPQKNNSFCTPDGRFDFIALEVEPSFNRDLYNLPKYSSEEELSLILKKIFELYEDFKKELK